jgi:hypothetical protein
MSHVLPPSLMPQLQTCNVVYIYFSHFRLVHYVLMLGYVGHRLVFFALVQDIIRSLSVFEVSEIHDGVAHHHTRTHAHTHQQHYKHYKHMGQVVTRI